MDANDVVIYSLFAEFHRKINEHFLRRDMDIKLTFQHAIGSRTRTYQHFDMVNRVSCGPRHPFGVETYEIFTQCYFNTSGPLKLFLKLGYDDPFKGAADFDPIPSQVHFQFDDIVRSFADTCHNFRRVSFNI